MGAKKLVLARYPRARAVHYPEVPGPAWRGVAMRAYWAVYTVEGTRRRRLGRGPDEAAAWRDAARRLGAEGG